MVEAVYTVQGMTCGHCASSVTEEVGRIRGVREITVDLGSGRVVVASESLLDVEQVRGAVDEAGFELVS